MVNATDLFVLALGGLLTVAFLYRDRLPFIGSPGSAKSPAAPAASKAVNGGAAAAVLGGYQGDVRDFATRMKDQVRLLQDDAAGETEFKREGLGYAFALGESCPGLVGGGTRCCCAVASVSAHLPSS